jgi:hypothetical protein
MESVNDVWYKQPIGIEFLVAENQSVRNTHKCLHNVYGSAVYGRSEVYGRSTTDHWVTRVTAYKTGKAELHNLPH